MRLTPTQVAVLAHPELGPMSPFDLPEAAAEVPSRTPQAERASLRMVRLGLVYDNFIKYALSERGSACLRAYQDAIGADG